MNYQDFFKGKKVTQMGLGLLGRGVGNAEFLAKMGVDLTVTDLKSEEELAPSLERLRDFKRIKYVLGEHRLEDFSAIGGRVAPDFILKSAGVPLDSIYIAEARKNNIPIEMDASLFLKLALAEGKGNKPYITFIGITGTRGKTTTTFLIYDFLKRAGKRVFLGGNVKDTATLPLLEKIEEGDIVVAELDSWQLQGFGESKISPHISVFTNFLDDHLNYYKNDRTAYFDDKANIFKFQTEKDFLVVSPQVLPFIKDVKSKVVVSKPELIKSGVWMPGEHNKQNVACAREVGRIIKISGDIIKEGAEQFRGVAGRLQFIKRANDVQIYNDTTATTPDATIAGIKALHEANFFGEKKKIVLIMGGADKGLDMTVLLDVVAKYCKGVVLLAGSGTEKIRKTYSVKREASEKDSGEKPDVIRYTLHVTPAVETNSLKDAVSEALSLSEKGDILLFSPAFASFGMSKNEYDRGERFVKLINSL